MYTKEVSKEKKFNMDVVERLKSKLSHIQKAIFWN